MAKIKVLLTGASGFLGIKMMKLLREDFELIGTDRLGTNSYEKLDITDRDNAEKVIMQHKPDVVIHNAAMTDVDRCEEEKDRADSINVGGTRNIAEACSKAGAKIVYISTDFVFDGKKGNYREDDEPNPLSHYAKTKLEGENIVRGCGAEYLIIRPEVLYGYNGDGSERSFVNWVFSSLKQGKGIHVVNDQFSTPTLIDDIAEAVKELIRKGKTGIYHVAGPERLSRYDMAVKLASVFSFDACLVRQIRSDELKQKALRPADSSLDIAKLKNEGILMHNLRDGLEIMKEQMKAGGAI